MDTRKKEKYISFVIYAIGAMAAATIVWYCVDVMCKSDETEQLTAEMSFNKEHAYVDLGLSVKWATCNVGANSPEQYGEMYAWGETEPKEQYLWRNYKYCNGTLTSLTKYCTDRQFGKVDGKTRLDPCDDVAHVKWGGEWRMPTYEEMKELQEKCTWDECQVNGVEGYKIMSKTTGKSIFLPIAGFKYNDRRYSAENESNYQKLTGGKNPSNACAHYWSSTLDEQWNPKAMSLVKGTYYKNGLHQRAYGRSVRPVHP